MAVDLAQEMKKNNNNFRSSVKSKEFLTSCATNGSSKSAYNFFFQISQPYS
jgi:hypothetical protein